MNDRCKLGFVYEDLITGFKGTATARTEYLYGCVRVCLEPGGLIDGKPRAEAWFDEQRLFPGSLATAGGPGIVAPERQNPPARE